MSLARLRQDDGHWVVKGIKKSCWLGVDGFKLGNAVACEILGEPEYDGMADAYCEHSQKVYGEDVIIRVFNENADWHDHPMFGAPPADPGIWDLADIRRKLNNDSRPIRKLTDLNEAVLTWFAKKSQETGVAFEICVDATLKHTYGFTTAVTDHAIRQVASFLRGLISVEDAPYPNAIIILGARNEWQAHNGTKTKLGEVNMWAERFYRWERESDGAHKLAFKSPGTEWTCRQWPEGYIVVDGSVGNGVNVGPEPGRFQECLQHPDRDPKDRKWWQAPANYDQMVADARGVPYGYNESKLYCDLVDKRRLEDWYRGKSYTTDVGKYMEWLELGLKTVRRFVAHSDKGMQANANWPRPLTRLEAELGGVAPPTPPPPPPGPEPVDFRPVISLAYRDLLNRPRNGDGTYGDRRGLDFKNKKMQKGMALADIEEEMIRSKEYREKHPD